MAKTDNELLNEFYNDYFLPLSDDHIPLIALTEDKKKWLSSTPMYAKWRIDYHYDIVVAKMKKTIKNLIDGKIRQ